MAATNTYKIPLNRHFYIPFCIWAVAGLALYFTYGSNYLFEKINSAHSPTLDVLMYYITMMGEAYVIVGVLLLLLLFKRLRNLEYFTIAVVANVLPMIAQQVLKSYFDRPRPLNFFSTAPWLHRLDHWPELYGRSFPSGHSEGAFAFFCILTLLLPPRFKAFGFVFFLLALAVCYSRIYLTAHFFEDTYAGSMIGVIVPTLCFLLFKPFVRKLSVAEEQ